MCFITSWHTLAQLAAVQLCSNPCTVTVIWSFTLGLITSWPHCLRHLHSCQNQPNSAHTPGSSASQPSACDSKSPQRILAGQWMSRSREEPRTLEGMFSGDPGSGLLDLAVFQLICSPICCNCLCKALRPLSSSGAYSFISGHRNIRATRHHATTSRQPVVRAIGCLTNKK